MLMLDQNFMHFMWRSTTLVNTTLHYITLTKPFEVYILRNRASAAPPTAAAQAGAAAASMLIVLLFNAPIIWTHLRGPWSFPIVIFFAMHGASWLHTVGTRGLT